MKINKDMLIGECITEYPQTIDFFLDAGIHCAGCFAASFETIEQGLLVHGKTDEEINQIIQELNNLIDQ
jgi:hybrid cluster-associated redox disulfide protein